MVTTYCRGHLAQYDSEKDLWYWCDTGEVVIYNNRPCKRCGKTPTPEGHDACLGVIPPQDGKAVIAACCGHGVEEPYLMDEDRKIFTWG